MKRFKYLLLAVIASGLCAQPLVVVAKTHHAASHAQASKQKTASKTARKEKTGTKSRAESRKSSGKSVTEAKGNTSSCRSARTRRGRHHKASRACAAEEPALKSPIQDTDLNKPALQRGDGEKTSEIKARTVPERAYAVDGETFFFQGRKFRVSGLSGVDSSEMAKQRLQKVLDAGAVAVEPVGSEDGGVSTAVVRVGGRNVVDLIPKP
ncbi:hypothetical protein [Uliginosibacterium gangwonense]|uniref:hypothetical protein n=1 Tax=Uliginosibacterium gangwonense TaxID=392736 RepID=UPI00037F2627|nr:hypothetical protein [Uliginosibacterium gangwonense]